MLAIAGVSVRIAIRRANPILRSRVVETLAARFHSRVELAELNVWIANGLHVEGAGLEIYGTTDPNPWEPGVQPLLRVGKFRFQTGLIDLFRDPMHVDTIYVTGLTVNIPPKKDRQQAIVRQRSGRMHIAVDRLICDDAKLVVNTERADKPPLEFDIRELKMRELAPGQPLKFDATLVNPKPVGDIHSVGEFGPLDDKSPRDSAVSGEYTFSHADLGTLKGIAGILSSTGRYAGTLGRIEVSGETDTPDFRLEVSGHRVPLHTAFHAIVDGTDGDTYLDPVQATVLHSSFTAKGKIARVDGTRTHDIELDVVLGHATIEDLLTLGVKTDPPLMTGIVGMDARLSLPPGPADLADRLKLSGQFHISNGFFTSDKIQTRIDELSWRSQGRPREAHEHPDERIPSDLQGRFSLDEGIMSFAALQFQVQGTQAEVTGKYSLDGNTFDFYGTLRLDAKLSQMTTGWKSVLLKPVDPFFHKDGAGTEIPFKITGTRSEPHFGLDFGHKEEHTNGGRSESNH